VKYNGKATHWRPEELDAVCLQQDILVTLVAQISFDDHARVYS